ncbi:hypothetical protein B0T18DRAFT_397626 [Schizothecium vesticola]|uniref:lytic cellulose monooxygenase (C4-dehydrogenating) n=1 Tax=Schizothecium vesticola TaxID=314040 RepID=A0AA40KC21_9PEZI|nr:hypothetical protein B0T18DRAFT_397626 [Schizothecium vesticola]
MRHEFIALHQANNPQFYPECPQIVVTGSGTAEPGSSYKAATDSNIKSPSTTTLCRGPPVWGKSSASKSRSFQA